MAEIQKPAHARQFAISLLQPLPQEMEVALYLSSGHEWQFVGSLSSFCPSGIFMIPLEMLNFPVIRLGTSLEPSQVVANLRGEEDRQFSGFAEVAWRVTKHLHDYLSSFVVPPSNAIDRWKEKMRSRLEKDPGFFLR